LNLSNYEPNSSEKVANVENDQAKLDNPNEERNQYLSLNLILVKILILSKHWVILDDVFELVEIEFPNFHIDNVQIKEQETIEQSDALHNIEMSCSIIWKIKNLWQGDQRNQVKDKV
jgi:hypothetical protein